MFWCVSLEIHFKSGQTTGTWAGLDGFSELADGETGSKEAGAPRNPIYIMKYSYTCGESPVPPAPPPPLPLSLVCSTFIVVPNTKGLRINTHALTHPYTNMHLHLRKWLLWGGGGGWVADIIRITRTTSDSNLRLLEVNQHSGKRKLFPRSHTTETSTASVKILVVGSKKI